MRFGRLKFIRLRLMAGDKVLGREVVGLGFHMEGQ